MDRIVSACLSAGGPLAEEPGRLLAATVERLERHLRGDVCRDDSLAYFRTRDLLFVAHLVTTAAA
jgi:hypothetical protein